MVEGIFSIPFFGDVSFGGLVFAAVAGLVGYIIGSQLKGAIKIALIVIVLATPAMLSRIIEWMGALKSMLSGFLSQQVQSELSLCSHASRQAS